MKKDSYLVSVMSGRYKDHEAIVRKVDDEEALLLIIEKGSGILGKVLIIDELKMSENEDVVLIPQEIH